MSPTRTPEFVRWFVRCVVAVVLLVAVAGAQTVELLGGPYRKTWPTVSVAGDTVRVTCYGGQRSWMAQMPLAQLEAGSGAASWTILHPLNPNVLCDEPMHATTPDGVTLGVGSGRYGIQWPGFDPPDSLMAPFGRIFDANGSPIGPDFPTVPDTAQLGGGVLTDWLNRVAVIRLPDGSYAFVVAWTRGSGTGEDSWIRLVYADGSLGPAVNVSAPLPSSQNYPDVAALDDGTLLATFRHTAVNEGGAADIWAWGPSGHRRIAGADGEQRETRLAPMGNRGWIEVHQNGTGGPIQGGPAGGSTARGTLIRRTGTRAGVPFDLTGSAAGVSWIDPRAVALDGARWVVVAHGRTGPYHVPCWRLMSGRAALTPLQPMFPDLTLYQDTGASFQVNRITPSVFELDDGRLLFAAAGSPAPGMPIRVFLRIEDAP